MSCPQCNAPLAADARFCPACGRPTSATETGAGGHAAAAAPDLVGREIAGRYRITKKLGEGGMGAVYRGEQISLKRAVAVKVLRPELGTQQMILRRFNAEAEAVAKLSHPSTVNIYDFGQDTDGSLFIAMEFIEGRSLRAALQAESPFSPARALAIALQVAASLSDAHAHSIVHRDLKPDNVMLQDRGRQKDVVRVLDFGIAKLRDDNRATQQAMTQAGDMLGTPQYMAPEQIKGEAIDGRTDIYALGCMIYEMVTGRMPFDAPTVMAMLSKHLVEHPVPPSQRRPDLALSPALDQLVLCAMAKEPAMRPTTMDQFSEMIGALLATLPADPNRSAGLPLHQIGRVSAQHGAVGSQVTPPALPAFGPPTSPPPGYAAQTPAPPSTFPPPSSLPPGVPAYPGHAASTAPAPGVAAYAGQNAPTAPPHGAFAPGSVQPGAYAPHAMPPAVGPMAAPAKSRAPLYAILGVLALGGVGAGVWVAMRGDDSGKTGTAAGSGVQEPAKDPVTQPPVVPDPDDAEDAPDPDDVPDPWADSSSSSAPSLGTPKAPKAPVKAAAIGTAETPIPKGAAIIPPPGFVKIQGNPTAVLYGNPQTGVMVGMASLYAGTNDPAEIAKMWSRDTGAVLVEQDSVFSHGANRPALAFTATVDNAPVVQVAVLYITSSYRLAVLFQAPVALFAEKSFQDGVDVFFANNVKLP